MPDTVENDRVTTGDRDPQARRVYRAEREWMKSNPETLSESDAISFCALVARCPWWRETAQDNVRPTLAFNDDPDAREATSEWSTGIITLPHWGLNRLVILHEMAHQLVGKWDALRMVRREPHGPVFAASFLALMQCMMPSHVGEMLHFFRMYSVQYGFKDNVWPSDEFGLGIRHQLDTGEVRHAEQLISPSAMRSFLPGIRDMAVSDMMAKMDANVNGEARRKAREEYVAEMKAIHSQSSWYYRTPTDLPKFEPLAPVEIKRPVPFENHWSTWLRLIDLRAIHN